MEHELFVLVALVAETPKAQLFPFFLSLVETQEGLIKVWEYIGFVGVNLFYPSEGGNIGTLLG